MSELHRPFALSLSKGRVAVRVGFDRLSPNGKWNPFALLSKGRVAVRVGFDRLSPNGEV